MSKWNELREVFGREVILTKRRSAQAGAAWSRHQGAHSPGTKKPIVDDLDEQLEEVELEEEQDDQEEEK